MRNTTTDRVVFSLTFDGAGEGDPDIITVPLGYGEGAYGADGYGGSGTGTSE